MSADRGAWDGSRSHNEIGGLVGGADNSLIG